MESRRCMGCMELISEEICPHCGCGADFENAPHQIPVGTVLRDQYLVGKVLGQGGFGITYIGWDNYLDMKVAIKEFYPDGMVSRNNANGRTVYVNVSEQKQHYEATRERFIREARALAKLRKQPSIVGVQGFFLENNTAYIVMEYIPGRTLRTMVRRQGKLSPEQTFALLEPVITALASVHRANMVHRDISPDNIILHPAEGAKLLDFGAVRQVENPDVEKDLDRSTEAIIKHGFAPMEQYRGRGSLGPWTDCYGLCATMYYCLTGQVPPDALARSMEEEEIDWNLLSSLPQRQQLALRKGLNLRAKDRFASMEQLHQALFGYQPDNTLRPPVEPQPPQPKPEVPEPQLLQPDPEVSNPEPEPEQRQTVVAQEKPAKEEAAPAKKKKPVWLIGLVTLVLLALMVGAALLLRDLPEPVPGVIETVPGKPETSEMITASLEQTASWEGNLLMSNPLGRSQIPREQIRSVIFLDSLEQAPADARDVSYNQDGSVLLWSEGTDVYIAADGGINAERSCRELFEGCESLEQVSFGTAFHTDYVRSFARMFYGCRSLRQADVGNFVTSNATSMAQMFTMSGARRVNWGELEFYGQNETGNLTELAVSGWDVSNVTDMHDMFRGCNNLKSLDISGWDTGKVTDMSYMFAGDFDYYTSYRTLDIGGWDVSSVRNMQGMFYCCDSLQILNLTGWDTGNVTDFSVMFAFCYGLKQLDVSGWNTQSLTDMHNMFQSCFRLERLDLSSWDTRKVTDMSFVFHQCDDLQDLELGDWETDSVTENTSFMNEGTLVNGSHWQWLFQ